METRERKKAVRECKASTTESIDASPLRGLDKRASDVRARIKNTRNKSL
jgi:hypothetical protein